MFLWLRELISSAFTFMMCLVGISVLMDPDLTLMRLEELGQDLFRQVQEQTRDWPDQISDFLQSLKRQSGR